MAANPKSTASPSQKLQLAQVLDWLQADGLIVDADKVSVVRNLAKRGAYNDRHPLTVIAERKWSDARDSNTVLTLDVLTQWLAQRCKLSYFRIDPLKVEVRKVTDVMSYAYASRFNILPVAVQGNTVTVATAEPFETEWEAELGRIQGKKFTLVVANPEDISRYRVEFYSVSKSVFGAEREAETQTGRAQSLEQLLELGRAGKLDANDQHVINLVDWLLSYAFEQRASDIHLEPRREEGIIRYRIDGVMHEVYRIPAAVLAPVTSRIKILGRMDIAEKRRPQDGRLKTRDPHGQEIELRLSIMPTAFGEKLVMRIFDPVVVQKNFNELGFDAQDETTWRDMIEQPHGIILVTGPTGSGKTTTLYTTLKHLAQPEVNVCTVEDPIELIDPALNQMQVQTNIDLDFASGVRTLLRQDPDIIMVGEIRDTETADMAVQAALTGHLVLSTLHTNDAAASITRLIDLHVAPFLIQSAVLGIIAQRLVRTLCPHCKQPADPGEQGWAELIKPWRATPPKQLYTAVGCLECRNTGYQGRVAIYEMLKFDNELRKHITPQTDTMALRAAAIKQGMKPLRLRGAQKVAEGLTTVEEVLRIAPPEEASN
ncbi:MAG TPA: GspE/PulE family protein [Gammaproteobacteria bacterium]|nr:GspE/PulE family protein [Gammaproteobacteria bacterium]